MEEDFCIFIQNSLKSVSMDPVDYNRIGEGNGLAPIL